MSTKVYSIVGCFCIIIILFCFLDCGLGMRQQSEARVFNSRYEPSRIWTTVSCSSDAKTGNSSCHPETHYEPEHYWAFVTSPLGDGRFDNRELFKLAPNGRCSAVFSRGRWTKRLWGPFKCEATDNGNW